MNSPITGKPMRLLTTLKSTNYRGKLVKYIASYYLCDNTGEEFTTTELDEGNLKSIHHSWVIDRNPRQKENKTEKILIDLKNKYKSWLNEEKVTKLVKTPNYIREVTLQSKIDLIEEIQKKLL